MKTSARSWTARWIRADLPEGEAPYLRAVFDLPRRPRRATAHVVAPGWHELFVNGRKAGAEGLSPAPMAFHKRVPWLQIDVAPLLREGRNAVAFLLGSGWYDTFAHDWWGFEAAPWRDRLGCRPRLLCEIVADGRVVLRSGDGWKAHGSPLVFNSLRGGETWDARREIPGFSEPDFDDAAWAPAVRCRPPGGAPEHDRTAPGAVSAPIEAVSRAALPGGAVLWDFGRSLAARGDLEVVGEAGAKVEIVYGENLGPDGDLDLRNLLFGADGGRFQRDEVVLAGRPEGERWHTRFTYHGFSRARTRVVEGRAEVRALRAESLHPAFEELGRAEVSDRVFSRLLELTRESFLANFAGGFPTDCPHREKNGWTGDAQLALETGLWNFAADENYRNHLRAMADLQRPDGAVPCMVPCARQGYGWGSGPAWDAYLFEGPWQLLRFRGDDALARELYGAMKRYVGFCESMAVGDLVDFGLGDWCAPKGAPVAPVRLTSSAYWLQAAQRLAFFARRFGRAADAARAEALAARVRAALRAAFRHPDGSWADDEETSLACALHFGLCDGPRETAATARRLAAAVRAGRHRALFGILGAKWVPRALAGNGYADDAFRLFVQTEEPGWGNWVARGATALWENWEGGGSRNHVMFGDLSAWAFEHLGGIRPSVEHPGFSRLELRPVFPRGLRRFAATHRTPRGEIAVSWRRLPGGRILYRAALPDGVPADVCLPGRRPLRGATSPVSLSFAEDRR